MELLCDPAAPEKKKTNSKDTCMPIFTAALFTIAKIWKQPMCLSTDEWIKMWYIYTYTHTHTMEYYSSINKNKIMPLAATEMDLGIIILSEASQAEKDKYM